jgi:hypothetical protein
VEAWKNLQVCIESHHTIASIMTMYIPGTVTHIADDDSPCMQLYQAAEQKAQEQWDTFLACKENLVKSILQEVPTRLLARTLAE